MHITTTEAKNRFGSVCTQAKSEQVFVEKASLVDTVILSVEHYQCPAGQQFQKLHGGAQGGV